MRDRSAPGPLKIFVFHPKQTRSMGDPGIDETPGGKDFTAVVIRVVSRKDHRMTTCAFECVVVVGLVLIINRGRMPKKQNARPYYNTNIII